MNKAADPDFLIIFLPFFALAAFAAFFLKRPWSHIGGVTAIWLPLVGIQIEAGRWFLALVLIVIAGFLLKSVWKDD